MPDDSVGDSVSAIDIRHLLLVGAGPGLGVAVARRFASGGYRVTLVARSTDGLRDLVDGLADTGAQIDTMAADASDPEGLRARMAELYSVPGAPGVIIYNAVMGAPDKLLSSSVEHLQAAYAVDVIGAIVVTQVAAPVMRSAGSGTVIVTGGGFADNPIPALATVSLGKAALRSAATMLGSDLEPDGIRVATLTITGQIVAGTAFDPENIAKRYWEVVHSDSPWQAEFRFTGDRAVQASMAGKRRSWSAKPIRLKSILSLTNVLLSIRALWWVGRRLWAAVATIPINTYRNGIDSQAVIPQSSPSASRTRWGAVEARTVDP
jgi:short-subunit dehydrogenase